jgi:hypothetical protein
MSGYGTTALGGKAVGHAPHVAETTLGRLQSPEQGRTTSRVASIKGHQSSRELIRAAHIDGEGGHHDRPGGLWIAFDYGSNGPTRSAAALVARSQRPQPASLVCTDKMRTVVPVLCQLTQVFMVCSGRNG